MPEAARQTDQISHTCALTGLVIGLAAGAVAAVGAALVISATVATGGVAGVLIGAGLGVGVTAFGGLGGEFIGAAASSPTGAIATGSPNVFIGQLMAARAMQDTALCSGPPLTPSHGSPLIAQGSRSVFINGTNAARIGDVLVCSAKISSGCATVFIGGAAATLLAIEPEVSPEENEFLSDAVWFGAALSFVGTAMASTVLVAALGLAGSLAGSWVGGNIGREIAGLFGASEFGRRIAEFGGGFLGSLFGGGLAVRAVEAPPAETPPPETSPPEESSPRRINLNQRQLQRKFLKHAADFGVEGNYNPRNGQRFGDAINQHVSDPNTQAIQGTYMKEPATLYYNNNTGNCVVADPSGNFITGWRLSAAQAWHVMTDGSLGGN